MLTWHGYALRRRGRALVIGLGGGILCRFLLKHFPNVAIEVVEPDSRVIEIARRDFDLDARIAVHCTDGRSHMLTRTGKYDIILLDAFDSTYVPADMMTVEFLEQVKRRLNDDGIMVSNTWVLRDITAHEDVTYTKVFGPFWDFRRRPNTDGNRIILFNQAAGTSADDLADVLLERARSIDLQSDAKPRLAIPGMRRTLTYAAMVEKLHIMQVLSPIAGKLLTDANIRVIRAKASFENEE